MSTSSDGSSKIIPRDNSSTFQSWVLPNVGLVDENTIEGDGLEDEVLPMLTADELEKIHQQAYSEGFDEGKLKGLKEGFEEGELEGKKQGHKQAYDEASTVLQEQIFYFQQINKTLEKPLQQTNDQVEHELMQLAFSIARHIIRDEVKANPEQINSLLKQSLNLLPSASKSIKIYLNPVDVSLVKEALSNMEDNRFDDFRILELPTIERGGCIVDTNISHIDASIEHRIELLAEKMIPQAPDFKTDIDLSSKNIDTHLEQEESEPNLENETIESKVAEEKNSAEQNIDAIAQENIDQETKPQETIPTPDSNTLLTSEIN